MGLLLSAGICWLNMIVTIVHAESDNEQLRNQVLRNMKMMLDSEETEERIPSHYPTKRTPWPTGDTSNGFLYVFHQNYLPPRKLLPPIGECPRPPKDNQGTSAWAIYENDGDCLPNLYNGPFSRTVKTITSNSKIRTFVSYENKCDALGKILIYQKSDSCNSSLETPLQVDSLCLSSRYWDDVICCGAGCWGSPS
jgi:hypothetical protein